MRISGGAVKGRNIRFKEAFSIKDKADELRPTASKVREALFDIIRVKLPGAHFLDLYAGTGGVGIEALSRGAAKVVFVESSKSRINVIQRLLKEFGFIERVRVIHSKVGDFIKREAGKGQKYDIIFLDPPYHTEELMKILPVIAEGNVLEEDGIVIAEHFFKKKLPESTHTLGVAKSYKYGDTMLTVYAVKRGSTEEV